jgi:hypothetical protein
MKFLGMNNKARLIFICLLALISCKDQNNLSSSCGETISYEVTEQYVEDNDLPPVYFKMSYPKDLSVSTANKDSNYLELHKLNKDSLIQELVTIGNYVALPEEFTDQFKQFGLKPPTKDRLLNLMIKQLRDQGQSFSSLKMREIDFYGKKGLAVQGEVKFSDNLSEFQKGSHLFQMLLHSDGESSNGLLIVTIVKKSKDFERIEDLKENSCSYNALKSLTFIDR